MAPRKTGLLPSFRPVQLATLRGKVPAGDGWLFETKFDGYRCLAAINGKTVKLFTRNGHDWTKQFGAIAPALSGLTKGTLLLDGEICSLDKMGAAVSPSSSSRWAAAPR